ncbi:MAG: NUDIX hydrolase [Anaerolineaceae bacterium]|nr:NUDIX hydrolase [Anaerolineaceae bacterium]MCB9099535.1 NUDIX hydrolase [Anaerolineales bacterium]
MKPEETLSEETLFTGQAIGFMLRQAQLTDGTIVQREIVLNHGAVAIVPITQNNEVRLVKQFRAAAQKWVIELPAGGLEPDEDPDLAAPRELLEETGDTAATWHKLHGFYTAPGILTEFIHLYLAIDLTPGPNNLEFDEHIEVITLPWATAIDMIRRHEIEDVKTIAGLMLAGMELGLITSQI